MVGLGAFVYILLVKNGNVPAASYVLVGGLIGLPNVINWQATLSRKDKPGSEREFRWKK